MKYEKKNNIGILLMIGGSLLAVLALFLLSKLLLVIGLIGAVAMIGVGGYLMTRGFTELDKDHPDYNRYQKIKQQE
jgi:ABC-type lipoprotein release transport system permease subunit